jgi:hypothetical protein
VVSLPAAYLPRVDRSGPAPFVVAAPVQHVLQIVRRSRRPPRNGCVRNADRQARSLPASGALGRRGRPGRYVALLYLGTCPFNACGL